MKNDMWREKMRVLAAKHGKNLENLSPCPECGQPFLYEGFTCAHCGYVNKRQGGKNEVS